MKTAFFSLNNKTVLFMHSRRSL